MSDRLLAFVGALAVVSLAPVLVAGQAPTASAKPPAAKTWTPPHAPDGRPDLQGVWNYATLTPLERPSGLAGRETLTDEEAADLVENAIPDEVRRGRPAADGTLPGNGNYNTFWTDRSRSTVVADKRTSLIVNPPDGRIPPLTPEGQKRVAAQTEARRQRGPADGPEDRNLWERCITRALPTLPGSYNNNLQLVQTKDYVVILNEMIHEARIIPLDGRPHGAIRQWQGDSRGRWEGNTLVVDTVNFTHKTNFRGAGENLHLVERYTRVNADTLLYEVTIADPTTWTKPWTVSIPMTNSDGIYEYECHEQNYGLLGILRGARVQEKAGEEAAKKGLK